MLDRTGVIFCSVSLIVASAACIIGGFQLAAMPKGVIEAAKVPVPPETLPELDLGGFGKVSVLDLMGYYIDNPPAPVTAGGGAVAAPKRFGGC
ncbi:MAG: hypothetical protein ACK4N6_07280 [Rhodocyclaceae bacterium]